MIQDYTWLSSTLLACIKQESQTELVLNLCKYQHTSVTKGFDYVIFVLTPGPQLSSVRIEVVRQVLKILPPAPWQFGHSLIMLIELCEIVGPHILP